MRLRVEHHTRYRFTEPQARVVQMLRLFPCDTAHQTVVTWRVDVDCDARLRETRDGFGNAGRMLYAEGPLDAIGITVSGEVLLTEADGVVRSTVEPFPPALFLRPPDLTHPDSAIASFANGIAGDGVERVAALNAALHARFALDRSRPGAMLSAADAFTRDRLTSRDLAQLFVAAARVCGTPARYVSGYSLEGGVERNAAAPHGWAEVHVDGRWLSFDPATGGVPELDHVRVAVALDAAGAAPIAGTRIGHGEEALDVDVHVEGVTAE